MHKPQPHDDSQSVELGYELTDIQLKVVFVLGVVFTVICLIGFIVGVFFVKYFKDGRAASTDFEPSPFAAGEMQWDTPVRLQENMQVEWQSHDESQEAVLGQYDVVSEDPALYQMPVSKAIEWVARDGLPRLEELPTVKAAQPQPQDGASQE